MYNNQKCYKKSTCPLGLQSKDGKIEKRDQRKKSNKEFDFFCFENKLMTKKSSSSIFNNFHFSGIMDEKSSKF